MPATHPFTGLVVIDFTHVLAGPACSHYLCLLYTSDAADE